jgi:hypothetical protein
MLEAAMVVRQLAAMSTFGEPFLASENTPRLTE